MDDDDMLTELGDSEANSLSQQLARMQQIIDDYLEQAESQ